MAKAVNLREAFKNRATVAEISAVAETIREDIKSGKIRLDASKDESGKALQVSIRNIAEATLGADVVGKYFDPSRGSEGEMQEGLREAVDPVKLSAFSNITGELVTQGTYEAYKSPEFIADQLCTAETSREDNTREIGLAEIDEEAMIVAENEEYDHVKFGEDYIDIPGSVKRGMKIALTKEMVFFDRTGRLAEMAATVGKRVGLSKEQRTLRIVLGIDNNHNRKGVARNTYVASADPRINRDVTGLELLDYTDLEEAWNLFGAYTDDRTTGEPIMVAPDTLLIPHTKVVKAMTILNATEIRNVTGGLTTISANPFGGKFKVLSSQWITWMLVNKGSVSAANAAKRWYLGQPKLAFRYRTLFPFAVTQARLENDDFDRDVVAQWKASERGVAYSRAPWFNAEMGDDT